MLTYATLAFGNDWPMGDPNDNLQARYIAWLFGQIETHCDPSARFVLFTDRPRALRTSYSSRNVDQIIVPDYGYHVRLAMFDRLRDTRVISFDLDTVILRNLRPLEVKPITYAAGLVPLRPTHGPPPHRRPGCGVMVWDSEHPLVREIARVHQSQPRCFPDRRGIMHPKLPHGFVSYPDLKYTITDEDFVWPFIADHGLTGHGDFPCMEDFVPGFVVNRRQLRQPEQKPEAGVVFWSGYPKPHSENLPWVPKLPEV